MEACAVAMWTPNCLHASIRWLIFMQYRRSFVSDTFESRLQSRASVHPSQWTGPFQPIMLTGHVSLLSTAVIKINRAMNYHFWACVVFWKYFFSLRGAFKIRFGEISESVSMACGICQSTAQRISKAVATFFFVKIHEFGRCADPCANSFNNFEKSAARFMWLPSILSCHNNNVHSLHIALLV